MSNPTLISIVGPTAIGKTSLSVFLANYFKTEIISSDSRQFYKEMYIGTAVPSSDELNAVKHHFIQHRSINDHYTVGDFEKDALSALKKIFREKKIAVMVGGSGLYINAVTTGLDYFPDVDPKIRESLNQRLKSEGLLNLQNQLKEFDYEAYNTIAIENPHRVIRALEICIGTAKPYSSYLNKKKEKRFFKTISIGLNSDRETLYDRINKRVDLMVEKGLIQEAKSLYGFKNLNALNTVGYKELFHFFDGEISLDFAISEIKKHSRRFAKRQLTWFRKDKRIKWFDYKTNYDVIAEFISNEIKKTS
ncbi:tRNA (adenosine(37)-N6)-dimethylallyltransferase MiaA [Winogradskyella alexanderae]|uniref:tRNA dimethylallyltransferase n=1 Tax=Winogradskyella alexanderae TaxID=2877123 RepID=A0ABS7XW03_9FLAO|nr:tRNA (adenosine(37)-N6)-dimethylallyltransferase MiaA [Winogradskyella alexanderae]MCA0133087.1 tRNA (adenosine(37)-N6)-dimethylallyltransferase MiaA [Winogradskyella alexanderae]